MSTTRLIARKLKISRFTIDVLLQRLAHLTESPDAAFGACEDLVHQIQARVADCDQWHDTLCSRFIAISWRELDAMEALNADFIELQCKITILLTCVNRLEQRVHWLEAA